MGSFVIEWLELEELVIYFDLELKIMFIIQIDLVRSIMLTCKSFSIGYNVLGKPLK